MRTFAKYIGLTLLSFSLIAVGQFGFTEEVEKEQPKVTEEKAVPGFGFGFQRGPRLGWDREDWQPFPQGRRGPGFGRMEGENFPRRLAQRMERRGGPGEGLGLQRGPGYGRGFGLGQGPGFGLATRSVRGSEQLDDFDAPRFSHIQPAQRFFRILEERHPRLAEEAKDKIKQGETPREVLRWSLSRLAQSPNRADRELVDRVREHFRGVFTDQDLQLNDRFSPRREMSQAQLEQRLERLERQAKQLKNQLERAQGRRADVERDFDAYRQRMERRRAGQEEGLFPRRERAMQRERDGVVAPREREIQEEREETIEPERPRARTMEREQARERRQERLLDLDQPHEPVVERERAQRRERGQNIGQRAGRVGRESVQPGSEERRQAPGRLGRGPQQEADVPGIDRSERGGIRERARIHAPESLFQRDQSPEQQQEVLIDRLNQQIERLQAQIKAMNERLQTIQEEKSTEKEEN